MKHRLLIYVFILFACLTAVGQVNQIWYKKGKVLYAVPVAGIDSVTYGQFLSADTFFIVIDRASRRIVYDTVDVHVPGMVYHDTIHTTHTIHLNPGRRIGVFSVAKDKQVSFSQGNLQYVQNQNVWKFADQQYEMIGARNVKDGQLANKIDLFGWSGKDSKIPYGVGSSTKYTEYKGDFVDWGSNVINYELPNTWRTLSIDEWEYIYYERENAQKLIALGTVNDMQGLIILPDNWHLPDGITFVSSVDAGLQWQYDREEGSYFNSSNKDHTKDNIYTEEQWQKMEEAGAVFLPCAGWRSGVNWFKASLAELKTNYVGSYWTSSSLLNNSSYYFFRFTQQEIRKYPFLSNLSLMARGRSVRLVHDTIVPPPAPCLVVKVNDTLSINLMCVEGGTFMMGAMDGDTLARNAEKPAHLVTLNYDYSIMQTEVTQEMWEAVMGEDIYDLIAESPYPDSKPISTKGNFPVGYVRLKQCLEFIDSLNARTGLHFRMPTEAEWEYAARGGHRSKGFLYSGSDDMSDVAHINYGIVAKLKPNELGIYDMSGNMAEMTLDYLVDHETGYPSAEAQVNPRRISSSGNRAVRGLKRFSSYVNLRISHRSAYTPSWCGPGMGFRLVLPEERDFRTIYVNGVYFDMAFVEGGTFVMGDDSSDNASPAHQVTLSDYYIGQTEVTQALWTAVMGTNPSKFRGNNLPVECVSWEDCQLFVQKLSEMTGLHFRLPTESEWEFAARGGVKSRGYVYAGSDDVDSVAWYGDNSGQKTHLIAGKKPNELGIYDMSGNVWEWCQDWHEPYTAEPQVNPQGASEGEKPVIRGGCWHYNPIQCTPTYRYSYYNRTGKGASTGLRIVLDISNKNE